MIMEYFTFIKQGNYLSKLIVFKHYKYLKNCDWNLYKQFHRNFIYYIWSKRINKKWFQRNYV
jgi:hypothetical protein